MSRHDPAAPCVVATRAHTPQHASRSLPSSAVDLLAQHHSTAQTRAASEGAQYHSTAQTRADSDGAQYQGTAQTRAASVGVQ